jgi:carboxymethylenebutenolidase
MDIQKSEIQLEVNGKVANAYLANGGGPGVLVLHAWWGLKPFFKQVCDQLAVRGYTALAPDLYQGDIAKTIDEAKVFHAKHENDFMGEIVKVAKEHLVSLRPGKPIGVIGFSMGAAWSMIVAADEPNVSAVVLFYGAYAPAFKQMPAKVLGHFAEVDEWEPLDGVRAVEKDLASAGVDAAFHIYPGAGHWFVESDRPEYDSAAASLAWERTFEFLKNNL